MAIIPPDLPNLVSDSDTSDSGGSSSAEMGSGTEAMCWYADPSLVEEIFDSPEIPLV